MKFLEWRDTSSKEKVLIRIEKITEVYLRKENHGWIVEIVSDLEWGEEYGDDFEAANKRYEEIKEVIEGA